jgi:cellulose synthase/poly-beta-1,6-N-acetylglucosamine synthase-like glycosyltransferase
LDNARITFEVIVMDDMSSDDTALIVGTLASEDARVRIVQGKAPPHGWCGKQFACDQLARQAKYPVLCFLDADVRLERDALARMVGFLQSSGADLVSGVPRQETSTPVEKLLIPLIHFVLLAYLPVRRMRRRQHPSYAAGCGQLFVTKRDSYEKAGGHAAVRGTLHDGIN